ncbi:retinaldehyde-binding protein 1-like [Culicoides brevitarsis]|uniref:retinaldehyde-binding protein 1-like n=1 Tax=Culicoides brevitarsis TaxID=469753 RepID=UPI00307BCB16
MQVKKYDEHGRPYLEICEGYEIRLDYSELSEADKEKARVELRETPENVEKGLKELREILANDDTLFVPSEYDEFLMKFLRPTKFYAKSAYKLMRHYYEFREKYPEYCKNLVPSTARLAIEHNIINIHPKRDQHRRRIIIVKPGTNWDHSIVSVNESFRALQLGAEAALLEQVTQVNGFIVIMDFVGLTLSQCLVATPHNVRMFMEWFQKSQPLRCKAIHVVNYPTVFAVLYGVFRPFIGSKIKKRVHFHGNDFKSLLEHVDADCLPKCYGGTIECEEADGKLAAEILEESSDEFELATHFGIVKNKHEIKLKLVPVTDPNRIGTKYALVKTE